MEQYQLEVLRCVQEFASRETNASIEQLCENTSFYHDLGVDGDEAEELLINFEKQFHVDMSQFSFIEHFNWELSILGPLEPRFWLYLFDSNFRRELRQPYNEKWQKVKIPLTVGDLVEAVSTGRWPNLSNRARR